MFVLRQIPFALGVWELREGTLLEIWKSGNLEIWNILEHLEHLEHSGTSGTFWNILLTWQSQ
jgi:hypothetical protein